MLCLRPPIGPSDSGLSVYTMPLNKDWTEIASERVSSEIQFRGCFKLLVGRVPPLTEGCQTRKGAPAQSGFQLIQWPWGTLGWPRKIFRKSCLVVYLETLKYKRWKKNRNGKHFSSMSVVFFTYDRSECGEQAAINCIKNNDHCSLQCFKKTIEVELGKEETEPESQSRGRSTARKICRKYSRCALERIKVLSFDTIVRVDYTL